MGQNDKNVINHLSCDLTCVYVFDVFLSCLSGVWTMYVMKFVFLVSSLVCTANYKNNTFFRFLVTLKEFTDSFVVIFVMLRVRAESEI